jgi:phenylalanyl-tRNA synthetase beta subunit
MSPKRRDFLKVATAGALAAGLPEISAAKNPSFRLTLPIVSNRVISHRTREVLGGKEHYTTLEMVGANGVKHVTDTLLRELDAHKIMTTRTRIFAGAADTEPQETHVHTIMAEVADFGLDKVAVTVSIADEDGITPPRTISVKRGAKNPVVGITEPDEVLEKILQHKGLKAGGKLDR